MIRSLIQYAIRNTRFARLVLFAVATYLTLALYAHAQGGFFGLSNTAQVAERAGASNSISGVFSNINTLGDFINRAFVLAISLGAIFAVGRLVYAGWIYITGGSWGSGASVGRAKEIIWNTIKGLLLLLSIWLILNLINPCLLNLDIIRSIRPDAAASCS